MIKAVMVMNTQGKPRLAKFYEFLSVEKQQELIRNVYGGCDTSQTCIEKISHSCLLLAFKLLKPSLILWLSNFLVLCSRAENVSNFMEANSIFGPETRLVYKHYATLYFVFIFDSCENELAVLDLIQVFVETLDKCFRNVCELDIVFNYSKMHTILDEIICGGQVLETSSSEVMKAVEEISKLEAASNSITLVPKTVSGWRGR